MDKLKSLLHESATILERLQELQKEAHQELIQVVRTCNITLPNGDRVDFHALLCEFAYAEFDCRDHFKRFPRVNPGEGPPGSDEDWSRCHHRRELAIDALKKVAIAYATVSDVMET